MKVKVSEWLAQYLVSKGIRYNFTVPGGGAMVLNMAFGHQDGLKNIFVQHEQSAAIAAEGFYRVNNELPMVCCTTGPGGTNTLTGVLGAWLDSIPMLIISGQVRYSTTARYYKLPLRAMGDQEFDITPMVAYMTKYAVMITDIKQVKYHVDKALYLCKTGRPGPVWLDIPLDIQGGYIDTDDFEEFVFSDETLSISENTIYEVIKKIQNAKRPVLMLGNGIHISGCENEVKKLVKLLNIPVCLAFDSTDLLATDDELYVGQPGLMGDRPGNWAIQNSDLILSIGCRLSRRQVGYDVKTWARAAFVIMVDIDKYELVKPSIHVEMPIQADARAFVLAINAMLNGRSLAPKKEWNERCKQWKKTYPVVLPKHYENVKRVNAYAFIHELTIRLASDQIIVLGNGTAEACIHAYQIKQHTRLISNSGAASMGYDLPAAIGACFASDKKNIVCVTGDGSIQMNLQELQTVVFHKLPIKIFLINNGGYHSMRQTEGNLFPEMTKIGVGPESHDLSFPEMKKIASAYGIPYYSIECNSELSAQLDNVLQQEGYLICELFVDVNQNFEPKSATKKLEDGRLVSPPLEDLAPFLPREELKKNMYIPLISEEK
ncbi:MAG: thiamine pyrophosphate-binding protein [Phascolarctobacterium sp.]|nr:thiamine pyrophosphate-binding protein [Phascolarctobacterium sp.]